MLRWLGTSHWRAWWGFPSGYCIKCLPWRPATLNNIMGYSLVLSDIAGWEIPEFNRGLSQRKDCSTKGLFKSSHCSQESGTLQKMSRNTPPNKNKRTYSMIGILWVFAIIWDLEIFQPCDIKFYGDLDKCITIDTHLSAM